LLVSLKRAVLDTLYPSKTTTTVTPVDVKEIWSSRKDFRLARRLSLGAHAVILGLLILPAAISGTLFPTQTFVALYDRAVPLILKVPPQERSGGGGGGRHALTPPSKGALPRSADTQLVPPMVEVKNLFPDLVVESTIVAPPLEALQSLSIQIGDPNGVVGPPSPGPGKGGGIGTGTGTGVGPGAGPGFGPGIGPGGPGGRVAYEVGGGVIEPVLLSHPAPEYSDDARRARIQGTVELIVIIRTDGSVQFESVQQGLGFGLEQKAIEAVNKWKFIPGKKDGQPVPIRMHIFVNFSIR
jgi:TonB family protein